MFDIGGGRILSVAYTCIHMHAHACFYVCKTHVEFFEVKICFEPKKLLQKWLECE